MLLLKYSDFIIKEGSINKPQAIYWQHSLEEFLNKEWSEISVEHFQKPKYIIKFRVVEKDKSTDYNYYSVIIEKRANDDFYYLENQETIKKFIKKFSDEFWKNASKYVDKLKYEPRCLGDLEHVRATNKYNL